LRRTYEKEPPAHFNHTSTNRVRFGAAGYTFKREDLYVLPSHHAAATALAAIPLFRRNWRLSEVGQFAAAAVLIDVDHYLAYAWRVRDLSLWRAYRFHRTKMDRHAPILAPTLVVDRARPFHAPALLLLLWLLARRWPALRPLALGALFHRALDYTWHATMIYKASRDGSLFGRRAK
jgi:hypothetical protein